MNLETLLSRVESEPETLEFAEVIQVIKDNYAFTATDFQCGSANNAAGSNEGSCMILAFAKMHNISQEKTPYLFGNFYREDVLKHPDGEDHTNIRNFISHGWEKVTFDSEPLSPKL